SFARPLIFRDFSLPPSALYPVGFSCRFLRTPIHGIVVLPATSGNGSTTAINCEFVRCLKLGSPHLASVQEFLMRRGFLSSVTALLAGTSLALAQPPATPDPAAAVVPNGTGQPTAGGLPISPGVPMG